MGIGDRIRRLLAPGSRNESTPAEVRAPTGPDTERGAQPSGPGEKRSSEVPTGTIKWVSGAPTVGGMHLTNESAGRIAAFSSCANVISQDMAKLPILVMEQADGVKRQATEHRVYKLLAVRPNPMQTPFQFKQFIWRCVVYRGNAFIQIQKDGAGRPVALYPLHPDAVRPRRVVGEDGVSLVKVFDVVGPNGRPQTLPADEVMHLMWDSEDGIAGISPIKQHALALGWAFVMAEFGSAFFANGAHSSLVVTIPEDVATDEEAEKDFKGQFDKRQGGVPNAGKPIYITTGGKVETISVTPEAAQYLDSRKFSRSEIAGICRVPSHKIGDNADMKYSNAEMQEQSYKNDGLLPWSVQFEEEALLKLFTEEERARYSVRHDFNGLLRADRKSRAEAHKLELQSGEKTLNEIRAENDDHSVEGGDVNLVMTNMTTYQAMAKNDWRPMKATEAPATATGQVE